VYVLYSDSVIPFAAAKYCPPLLKATSLQALMATCSGKVNTTSHMLQENYALVSGNTWSHNSHHVGAHAVLWAAQIQFALQHQGQSLQCC
jgi:hypothetical protein